MPRLQSHSAGPGIRTPSTKSTGNTGKALQVSSGLRKSGSPQGGGEALPTQAEAARAGRADLALVLGTSGQSWEGRAPRLSLDLLSGRREAWSGRGAGLIGPFKALTSRGGSGIPFFLQPPSPFSPRDAAMDPVDQARRTQHLISVSSGLFGI